MNYKVQTFESPKHMANAIMFDQGDIIKIFTWKTLIVVVWKLPLGSS